MRLERPRRFRLLANVGDEKSGEYRLPTEIAFLELHGVASRTLHAGASLARRQGCCAAKASISHGLFSERFYYRALARHLDLPFMAHWPKLNVSDPEASLRLGCLPLADTASGWLIAPEGETLRSMLSGRVSSELAITTPSHFAALVGYRAERLIEHCATESLSFSKPLFCARGALNRRTGVVIGLVLAVVLFILAKAPTSLAGDALSLAFFLGIIYRLSLAVAGSARLPPPLFPQLADAALPTYSVLVPLRQEEAILPHLLAAMDTIDYPRAKLQVLLLIEPEDRPLGQALRTMRLPPWVQVVITPRGGGLRTKPRALNIGLAFARGHLVTVYDAEDRPASDQLRRAAAYFQSAPRDLACLQARLAVPANKGSLLSRLFAVEYAALFGVLNVGTARLGLPLALGGTSNHFRRAALQAAGGWDAWNVTEDADLGLRLVRLGYRVDCLDSATQETALDHLPAWLRQRRRWMKGWMQTFLVLARDLPNAQHDFEGAGTAAVFLLFVNLIIGPMLFPLFAFIVCIDLWRFGMPQPHGAVEVLEATLSTCVFGLGLLAAPFCGWLGLRATGQPVRLRLLICLVPYQLLISFAAWWALLDLFLQPYHWHKTPHVAPEL